MLNRARLTSAGLAAFIAALSCIAIVGAAAQAERIELRRVPQPDQWVQFHMTQEMTTAPAGRSATAKQPALPDMNTTMAMTFTQTTGHPDADGRVRAEVSYDEISATMTTAGKTTPIKMPAGLLGQQMTATYDAQGKIVDLQAPPGTPAATVAQIRQMMTTAFSGMPVTTIAVGETVSTPMNLTLPASTGPASSLTGTNTMTLRSISEEGGERIAHFDQKMELAMESARKLPTAVAADAPTMTMSMKMAGTGTMDYNVNRGFIVASRMQSTMDTKTGFDKSLPGGMPNFDMHMIMKMSIDATY